MGRKKTKKQRNCLCCGKVFEYHAHRHHEAKYCSRPCYFKHKQKSAISRANYKENENGCWIWQGKLSPEGYGRTSLRSLSQMAHRAIWQELRGPIPKGMVLDHKCRERACVNPDHLRVVTLGQNNHMGKVMRGVFAWRGIPDPSKKHHVR